MAEKQLLPAVSRTGHRPGHGAYEFATDDTPILHIGDAVLHPQWIEHPDWPATIETLPEQAIASRKMLLERAEETLAIVIGTHLPWPGIL